MNKEGFLYAEVPFLSGICDAHMLMLFQNHLNHVRFGLALRVALGTAAIAIAAAAAAEQ